MSDFLYRSGHRPYLTNVHIVSSTGKLHSKTGKRGRHLTLWLSCYVGRPAPDRGVLSSTPHSNLLIKHTLGDSADGSRAWVTLMHVGNPNSVSGSWLQPSPAPAAMGVW